jgi:hypothetical protein
MASCHGGELSEWRVVRVASCHGVELKGVELKTTTERFQIICTTQFVIKIDSLLGKSRVNR